MPKFLIVIAAFLACSACNHWPAPEGTRHLTDEERRIAELTADFLDVSEECRNLDNLGMYQAWDNTDFYPATAMPTHEGGCAPGWDYCPSDTAEPMQGLWTAPQGDPEFTSLIVLVRTPEPDGTVSGPFTSTYIHELQHHYLYCQYGDSGLGHQENPLWNTGIGQFFGEKWRAGEMPARLEITAVPNI